MLFQITHDLRQQNLKYNLPDKSEYEDPKLGDNNSHLVDSHLNNIQLHNSYSKEIKIEMEQLEHEDSNSAHSQSLDSIDLNNHDLTNQDLSNHSFKIEESIMVDSSTHSIQDPQITENNLNLMQQHQLSSDQFRLQHLHINMGEDNSGNDVQLTNNEVS
ncbi:hypothetical protein NQ314_018065 [Rhamnusium bicolor]|uniref:Uncharacterized protein n=1 Tax=Rhamnusium bicolor TaxID=1586634 RepID=A0AAV8WSQ2_9CUCU|nr:hypothetical protein NQ314_018065 [Rhamnusium bicolor]